VNRRETLTFIPLRRILEYDTLLEVKENMSEQKKQINVRDIPPAVLKEAKKKAIDEGISLGEAVRELLRMYAEGKIKTTSQQTK
jgi:predicted HicB family RNase H-like nuclease